MRKLLTSALIFVTCLAPLAAQPPEENPCQIVDTKVVPNPTALFIYNEALVDPGWADQVSFEIYQKGLADPVGHLTMTVTPEMRTAYPNCWKIPFTPGGNLVRDGVTEYYSKGRAQHSLGLRGGLSPQSNPFVLTPIGQKPIPASVVRVGNE